MFEPFTLVIDGFADFNARVRTDGGFHLHHPGRERVFPTSSGKAGFYPHALDERDERSPAYVRVPRIGDLPDRSTEHVGVDL